jgi:hypothetical protein
MGDDPSGTLLNQETQMASNLPATTAVSPAIAVAAVEAKSPSQGILFRWLEINSAMLSTDYRGIYNSNGTQTNSQMLGKDVFKGRLKLDPKGNFSIAALVGTGTNFTSSWTTLGPGTGIPISNHYLKQLYLSAKPVKGLEVQYGGLEISRGESTEITSYDNDGYIVGERVRLKNPKVCFFDEISATYAYLGDLTTPNLLKRFHRLQQSNYHQFLVGKSIGKRTAVSGDYSFQWGIETLRQAIKMKVPELKVADSIRFENYQRLDVKPDFGWGTTAEKAVNRKLSLASGYANIDPNYGNLNGNRYFRGQRVHFLVNYALTSEVTLSSYFTHAFQNDFLVLNNDYMEFIFNYNMLKGLQRAGLFRGQ